jgi:DNA-binding CsgD family transcriptional regulator
MDIKDYAQMMSYLTRPRDVVPEPRPMAQGGRIGFYKGESVVKSHGQKIKELTEAGESSVSIAKKLKLKQQTVNSAINAMDKGIAGEKFKLSKPRSEIIKLAVNETGVNLKDPKYLEEVIQFIDDNPTLNKKEAAKIIGRKRADLVPASSYGNPGKRWDDEKTKLRRDAEKAWTNRYSNISIEDKTRGDKIFHRHHAGSLREKVGTDNTMFLKAQDNYKNIRPFENAINDIQKKQYQTNLNRNMPLETKKEIFADLKKQEDALRAANPQFSDYKSSLVFEETPLSKTGYMMKEEMPNPELTISEGKTGQKIKYKNITPSSDEGKKAIELNKKSLTAMGKNNLQKLAAIGCPGKAMGGRIGFFEGQNLNACATKGVEKLQTTDIKKLTPGDKANVRAITKTVQGGRLLKNVLGPGALAVEGLFALPFAAYDYASGRPGEDVFKNAITLGLMDNKLKTNELKKIYPEYGAADELKAINERVVNLDRLSKGTKGQRLRNKSKLKKVDEELEEAFKPFINVETGMPDINLYQENLKKSRDADQELLKQYDIRKQERTSPFDLSDPFMAAKGGIASLNVKK